MFTEQDSARQDAAFAELKEEFSRLEAQEKAMRKAAGLPEEGGLELDEADMTPAVRQELEEAKAKAQREGAARAAQYQNGTSAAAAGSGTTAGRRRQGVVRI